jgi:anti-anti-sigma factor
MSPTAPGELTVASSTAGQTATLALAGELDIATAPQLERKMSEVDREGVSVLVLDLRNLSFIDSTGLRVVLGIADAANEKGIRPVIVRGPAAVQRVFVLTGAERELTMVDDPAQVDEIDLTA